MTTASPAYYPSEQHDNLPGRFFLCASARELVHSVAAHDDGISGVLSLGTLEAARLCAVTGNADDHSDYANYALARYPSDAHRARLRGTDERAPEVMADQRTRTGHLAQYAADAGDGRRQCSHCSAQCGDGIAHSVSCDAYIAESVGAGADAQFGTAVAEHDTDASCASDVAKGAWPRAPGELLHIGLVNRLSPTGTPFREYRKYKEIANPNSCVCVSAVVRRRVGAVKSLSFVSDRARARGYPHSAIRFGCLSKARLLCVLYGEAVGVSLK